MKTTTRTIFENRRTVWDGLGKDVRGASTAEEVLELADLNWQVEQKPIYTEDGIKIPGYRANIRATDQYALGVVSDKYKVVQNRTAFAFSEELLKHGFRYQYAGVFQQGRKTWVLIQIPDQYIINGERICSYLVFLNSHDASSSFKIAITPIRMLCSNMLNLALGNARRVWSFKHSRSVENNVHDALETMERSVDYMEELGMQIEKLGNIPMDKEAVERNVHLLLPVPEQATALQEQNVRKQRKDMLTRFYKAPDLQHVGFNAYRFINAVSDFETHSRPLRETATYRENLFERSLDGNRLVDKAMKLVG